MRVDVAIVGAGPAGCALAIRLRKAGISAAIFTAPRRSVSGEIPETLPPGIGDREIWPVSRASLRPHYAMMSAWGSSTLTTRDAICNPFGHGWFVDRAMLDWEMLAEAAAGGAVPVIHSWIASASRTDEGWSLRFSGRRAAQADIPVEARVVVDASGRSSAFARKIGVRRIALDRLVCLSAKAVPAGFRAGEALVESVETGWWFSALNSSRLLSISFFTNPAFTGLRGAFFERALRSSIHTSKRVSDLLPERPISRAARTEWLERPAGHAWLAIGDAAFASDPLGSQGLVRALETADKAAAVIASGLEHNAENIQQFCQLHVDYVDRFLRERSFFYSAEQRWPEAPFWKRVRAASGKSEG